MIDTISPVSSVGSEHLPTKQGVGGSSPSPGTTVSDPAAEAKTLPRHPQGHFFVMAQNHAEKFGDPAKYPVLAYPNLERARSVAVKMAHRTRVAFMVFESVPVDTAAITPAEGAQRAEWVRIEVISV